MRQREGVKQFTLVEMLVVIAIIGILAALLMPSLQNALESARTVECSNNKRQVYLGFFQYAESYRFLPPRDTGAPDYIRWYNGSFIGQYIGVPGAYNSNPKTTLYNCPSHHSDTRDYFGSGYNAIYNNRINRAVGTKAILPLTAFQNPSRVVLLTDTSDQWYWNSYDPDDSFGMGPSYRHNGKCTLVFAAGNTRSSSSLDAEQALGKLTHIAAP